MVPLWYFLFPLLHTPLVLVDGLHTTWVYLVSFLSFSALVFFEKDIKFAPEGAFRAVGQVAAPAQQAAGAPSQMGRYR